MDQAHNRHYSTFSLYEDGEFDEAMAIFERRLRDQFADLGQITWHDEKHTLSRETVGRVKLSWKLCPERVCDGYSFNSQSHAAGLRCRGFLQPASSAAATIRLS